MIVLPDVERFAQVRRLPRNVGARLCGHLRIVTLRVMQFTGLGLSGPHGWCEVALRDDDGLPPRVLVKLARDEASGRAIITRMIYVGDAHPRWPKSIRPVTSATLRSLPIGRIEAAINKADLSADIFDGEARDDGFGVQFAPVDAALADYLDQTELRWVSRSRAFPATPAREPLTRPDGTDPDAFSRRVAQAYTAAVESTGAPAKALADEAGVPVTTVHRWIREARQRGHLPPARKGRAG